MTDEASGRLLLTDSTMPVNFCRAGAHCALRVLEHLGERLYMVADVEEELRRQARSSPALQRFLDAWPGGHVRGLDLALTRKVAETLTALRTGGEHPREDAGEIATVFYAERRRDEGERFALITDDAFGKQLARDRSFTPITTPQLVVEMVCAGAIGDSDGERVWRQCFTDRSKWPAFKRRVEERRGKGG